MRETSLIVSRQGIRITLQKQTADVQVSRVSRVMQRSHFSEAKKRIKRANIDLILREPKASKACAKTGGRGAFPCYVMSNIRHQLQRARSPAALGPD
jgi:hypothetical protein